jgi:DNA-binding PadR family transcriptional regulator
MSQGIGKLQRLLLEILAGRGNAYAATIAELTSLVRVHTGRREGSLRSQIYLALRQLKRRGLVFMVKENGGKTSRYRLALSGKGRTYADRLAS